MRSYILFLAALPALAADPFTAHVVSVQDCDTITVEAGGRDVKVQLFGIDCPEAKQDGGLEARSFTTSSAMDRSVMVVPHSTDRYGRIVADVMLPDGRSLNKALVSAGWAWWYSRYAPNASDLQRLEAIARENRSGLWSASNPTPPWEWRDTTHPQPVSQGRSRTAQRSKRRDNR